MPARASWYPVRGVKPDYSGEEEFYIEADYVDHLKESGQLDKWWASPVITDVLQKPTSTFRGLKRPGNPPEFAEGLIYCGRPKEIFGRGGPMPAPPGYLLAVYIVFNQERDFLHVYDWDWKEEDENHPGFPECWATDYGVCIWPTI